MKIRCTPVQHAAIVSLAESNYAIGSTVAIARERGYTVLSGNEASVKELHETARTKGILSLAAFFRAAKLEKTPTVDAIISVQE